MEPERLLPCSQPATGPYSEPGKPSKSETCITFSYKPNFNGENPSRSPNPSHQAGRTPFVV